MANVDSTDTKSKKVANHKWIGPAGTPVDSIEGATGISYEDIASKKVVNYQIPGATAGSVLAMLASFGARTLATNTSSANRQDETSTIPDGDAVEARFLELADGDWGASRGGGGGFGMDVGAMADAILAWAVKAKKDAKPRQYYLDKLTAEKDYRKAVKGVTAIMVEYQKLTGGNVAGDSIL